VKTVASLNSIMVDATGMCGACMVPVVIDGKLVRKHACIDGPEIDAHLILALLCDDLSQDFLAFSP